MINDELTENRYFVRQRSASYRMFSSHNKANRLVEEIVMFFF